MLCRSRQALRHRRRPDRDDIDRRRRRRDGRSPSRRRHGTSSTRRSSASAVRSSCRSRPPRRSRSAVSARTSWPGAASPWRCRCGARSSTRSTSSPIQGSAVRLELHVSSGTYVRAIAEALGGHCTSLRRTAVGPFRCRGEADAERAAAGRGCARRGCRRTRSPRVPDGVRDGRARARGGGVRVAHAPGGARTAAPRGRDRDVRRRPPRPSGGARRHAGAGGRADGRHLPSASARRARLPGRSARARSSGGSSCSRRPGSRRRWSSSSRPRSRRSNPRRSCASTWPGSAPRPSSRAKASASAA